MTVIFSVPQTELGPVLARMQAGATLNGKRLFPAMTPRKLPMAR